MRHLIVFTLAAGDGLASSAGRVLAMLVTAIVLFGNADANALEVSWVRTAATQLPGNSGLVVEGEGGGSDPNALMTSGLNVPATTYQASASILMGPLLGLVRYSSSYTSLAGGSVGYGYMNGIVATSIRSTYGPNEFSRADLRANWTDVVTMVPDDPALLGTPGSALGGVLLDFHINSTATASGYEFGNASFNESYFSIAIGGGGPGPGASFVYYCGGSSGAAGGCNDGLSPPQSQTISVPAELSFTWGMPFELAAELTAVSMSRGPVAPSSDPTNLVYRADGSVDLLSTVLWQGISDARDSGNNPVGFTVTSDSHTDWARPVTGVPEPGTFTLLLTSIAGVLVSRRRR